MSALFNSAVCRLVEAWSEATMAIVFLPWLPQPRALVLSDEHKKNIESFDLPLFFINIASFTNYLTTAAVLPLQACCFRAVRRGS